MKIRLNGRELGYGVFLPALVALTCWGCGAADAAPSTDAGGQGDPRMYNGCADGRSLEQMQRIYGLAIPAAAKVLRYCDQESWSGSEGELQFDTSKKGLHAFLTESGQENLNLVKGEPADTDREWQELPTGVSMESGTYVNRIDDCDNAVMLDIQDMRAEKVRVYIRVVCAS
ncbi:hypothetical protein [Streptomyces sp. NPDC060205]|uniref:hypothetical protein n=1 Tax=Streptomyces sp. NPDC060205 TaxID=3347072 RepID=UPI00364B2A56